MAHEPEGHCSCCKAESRYKRYRWLAPVAVAIFKIAWRIYRS
jgi:hypothetical protein